LDTCAEDIISGQSNSSLRKLTKVDGVDILIQSRIEGVALCVAWPYLSYAQKSSFKQQTQKIATALLTLKGAPQYVVPDPNPIANRGICQDEYDILFTGGDSELGFSHNDLQPSNIIVNANQIVGIVDWEMSGFFGERAATVHRMMRCPGKEAFADTSLSKEEVEDLTFWSNLLD
jgi:hypothetical protein